MNLPLAVRIAVAMSIRSALVARSPGEVCSEVVNDPCEVDEDMDEFDDRAMFPRLEIRHTLRRLVQVDFLPDVIVIRSPARVRRREILNEEEIVIEEGIGGRIVLGKTEEEIAERVLRLAVDLWTRTVRSALRKVRNRIKLLRDRETWLERDLNCPEMTAEVVSSIPCDDGRLTGAICSDPGCGGPAPTQGGES